MQKKCINVYYYGIMLVEGGITMLIDYTVKGYKVFSEETYFSMESDNYIKSHKENIFSLGKVNLVKSAIIYGPNNTGKSTFISSIKLLKALVLETITVREATRDNNIYNLYLPITDRVIEFNIKFLLDGDILSYTLFIKYNIGIIKESLAVNDNYIFDTNDITNTKDEIKSLIEVYESYKDKLIISTLPKEYMQYTAKIKKMFENIVIFNDNIVDGETFNNFNMNGVYDFLSSSSKKEIDLFNKAINQADISIDEIKPAREELDISNSLKINSVHSKNGKKVEVPSIFVESDGSKRYMRYIAQIIKAFEVGKIILIDEIDNSLHTILTRSLISLFNSENNTNTQLIASSHDLLLLDTENLFRKDQIWFIYKDKEEIYLYSLDDINDNEGARNKTMTSYLKGMFGALPNPNIGDLFDEKK